MINIINAVNKLCGDFNVSEADVWEMSPVRLDGKPQDDFKLVCDWLFKPGELLNVVTDFELDANNKPRPAGKGITRPREEWLASGLPACKAGGWMRMNPVDGQGVADSNVTSFRFALLECDTLPLDLQLRLLARLPLPVAMILKSGKRSLHAWIQVDAPTLDDYRARVTKMLELLAPVGVDTKNKNASCLSRLPGGCRELDGELEQKLQRVLYLNPNPNKGGFYALYNQ
jgi:hypothetical protein